MEATAAGLAARIWIEALQALVLKEREAGSHRRRSSRASGRAIRRMRSSPNNWRRDLTSWRPTLRLVYGEEAHASNKAARYRQLRPLHCAGDCPQDQSAKTGGKQRFAFTSHTFLERTRG